MTPRRLLVLPLALLAAGMLPSAAHASANQLSVMMDDDNLVYRNDATRDATLRRMAQLGVDEVRVTVLWSVVADHARNTAARDRRFRMLGADSPRAYPKLNWDRYDRLAKACVTLHIGCYFDVTGPGPAWGHEKAPASHRRDQRTWKPKANEFKLFVKAVGKRYSGTYRDENDGRGRIARVSFWALWNEPNQGGWLTPQWSGGKPYSPSLYRKLYVAGHQGLVSTGHGRDTILLGETAPLGSNKRTTRSPMYPATFIRALFCVDAQGNLSRGGVGCSDFSRTGPLVGTAWAHHPYTKSLAPTTPDPSPNSITLANLSTLTGLLDRIAARTGYLKSGLPVALTEFGYETNPPDPFSGISLARQASYLNFGDFLAWANPRVLAQTQFLLKDVPPLPKHRKNTKAYWFTYQSGLFMANGTPKPSSFAYRLPLVALPLSPGPQSGAHDTALWGQLRFRPNGAVDQVTLEYKPSDGSADWAPLGDPVTVSGPRNFFLTTRELPGAGVVRAHWHGTASPFDATSREIAVPPGG